MKKASKERKPTSLRAFLLTLVAVVALLIGGLTMANAAAGQPPAHTKTSTDNGDGTHNIRLTVTGDADESMQEAGNVNVLIVYDTSSSMTSTAQGSSSSRADQAEDVVHDFLTNLAGYQNAAGTNINVALVTFARSTDQHNQGQTWTTNVTGLANRFDDGGTDRQTSMSYSGTQSNGTNWQAALAKADGLLDSAPGSNVPTFVIMITDGACTASGNGNNAINPSGASLNQLRPFYEAALENARNVAQGCQATGGTFYGIYAYGTEADLLDDLMYYANTGTERTVRTQTDPTDNYYNTSDTAALNTAINEIFSQVVQAMGITSVSISDGTTNQVTTTSGDLVASLLGVDESTYRYWMDIPLVNNQFKRTLNIDGRATEITYTVTDNGNGTCTVTWTQSGQSKTEIVKGKVSPGKFEYEWERSTGFYEYAPNAAHLVDGAVEWDLTNVGVLLNGVTYAVTFDVYPSQTALDYKARLDNGESYTDVVPPEARQYFDEHGNLKTNTTGTVTYSDTRLDNPGPRTTEYTNPPAIETESNPMHVQKVWEGGSAPTGTLQMEVVMDGKDEPFEVVDLNSGNSWKADVNISFGIIRHNVVMSDAPGHDFSFAELGSEQYNWELDAPIVHPMIIDGVETYLVKADDDHQPGEGAQIYTINDATYYVDSSVSSLSAVNHRRSNLNLTKVVDGEDAPESATFPFELTVINSKAPKDEPTDDPEHQSDYWVWFSIYDTGAGATVMNADVVSGKGVVGPNDDGYYYAPSGTVITVQMKAKWNLRFLNLPSGSQYTFVEGDLPESFAFSSAVLTQGEDTTFSGARTTTGTIENTQTSYYVTYTNEYALTDLVITKEWDDNGNQDGMRPTAQQFANMLTLSPAVEGATPTVVDNGNNTYTITYTDLPRFSGGQEVTYTVAESAIEGYTTEGSSAQDHGTITNTHTPEVTSATVTKVWSDADNQDGIRPESLTVTLSDGHRVTLNAANKWTATVENLPKYKDGELIQYTWTEGELPEGYTLTGTSVEGTVTTITNTHEPAETTVTVTKVWVDNDNQDGIRPTADEFKAKLILKAGDEDVTATYAENLTVTDNGDGTYTATWTGLPEKANGTAITYTVDEGEITGYTASGAPASSGGKITNTHEPAETTVTVTKVWVDNDNQDGIRPTADEFKAKLILKAGDEDVTATYAENLTVTDNGDGTYTATWTGLPEKANGTAITYTVDEGEITGYTASGAPASSGGKITNTHEPAETTVTVTKVWVDNDNQDGIRPTADEFKAKLILKAGDEDVTEDYAENLTVTDNGDGTYTATWTGLPEKANGTAITYTVDEGPVPEGYTASGAPASSGGKITNTHEPAETTVTVTKVWVDNDNQDGIRPTADEFKAKLILKAGDEDVTEDYAENLTVTDNGDGTYTATWTGLPEKANGTAITYTVDEGEITGYTASGAPASSGGKITNTHEPAETTVTATKVWDDDGDRDRVRPESVTLRLTKPDPDGGTVVVGEATLNGTEDTPWTVVWSGLPKNDKGEEIEYSVEEVLEDGKLNEYYGTPSIEHSEDRTSWTVTNHHTPEVVTVDVEKVWRDAENQDGIRPESVTVQLMVGSTPAGEIVPLPEGVSDTLVLNEESEWKGSWEGLPKNEAGQPIEYTVVEISTSTDEGESTDTEATDEGESTEVIPGYTTTVEGSVAEGYIVYNTHEPELISISITKKWDDANDQDGKRPSVSEFRDCLTLTAAYGDVISDVTDEYAGKLTVKDNEDGTYTVTWTDIPKYQKVGQEVTYTVTEATVPDDYEIVGDATAGDGETITNYHKPEETTVTVTKVWDDDSDNDGIRPEELELTLNGAPEGVEVPNPTITKDGDTWTYTWEGLPKYNNRVVITYTVTEAKAPDGYECFGSPAKSGGEITNRHELETTEITVNKAWDDKDDKYDVRPSYVTVHLLANGDEVYAVSLYASSGWTYTFKDLLVYDDGEKIEYTVVEDVPEHYTVDITGSADDGFTVTNTLINPVAIDPPVEKVVKGSPSEDATFTFQMVAKTEGAPMPDGADGDTMTMQIIGSGSREFGEIVYFEPGTYVYEITEVDEGLDGYTYDTTAYTLTVEVTANEDGSLSKTEIVTDSSGNKVDHIVFTNTYEKKPGPKPKPDPDIPQTGDPTNALPAALLAIIGGGCAIAGVVLRRRKED